MTTTTKATHTPGPWEVIRDGRQGHSIQHRDSIGNTLLLAYVHGINEGSTANARLIAKAPEMAAVLERALGVLRDIASEAGDDPMWNDGGDGRECCQAIRATLADLEAGS